MYPARMTRLDKSRGDIVKRIALAALVLSGLCVLGSSGAAAQDSPPQSADASSSSDDSLANQQMVRASNNIRSFAKQIVAANLNLTDNEATKFWPVYEQYSTDLGRVTSTRIALIEECAYGYGPLSDDEADSLIRRWLDADISAAQLRQKYISDFRRVLPGKKAAMFFQLDRRISTMIDVQLSSQLSLLRNRDAEIGDQNQDRL
jgi:Spy/CpxP family protein refolding chaperone